MRKRMFIAVPMLIGAAFAGGALGAPNDAQQTRMQSQAPRASSEDRRDADQHIQKAMQLVHKMKSSEEGKQILSHAKGVFLVPDYGRVAAGVGASGGAGVLLTRSGDTWNNPLFYNMGAVSAGPQAGISAGEMALVLMNDKAVKAFRQNNKFSLDANAGLTIVNWSTGGEGSWGRGDIVLWSETEGAYAGATVAISDVNFDEKETRAYYGTPVSPAAPSSAQNVPQGAKQLKQALALNG